MIGTVSNSGLKSIFQSAVAVKPEAGFQNRFLALEAGLANNPLLGRVFIEWMGDFITGSACTVLLGRGLFPVLEKFIDSFFWSVVGIGAPVLLIKNVFVGAKSPYTRWLKSKYELSDKEPLLTPFRQLDENYLSHEPNRQALARQLGLAQPQKIGQLAAHIRRGKLWAMAADFLMLVGVSQFIFTFRNWIISKLAGREGFSGEFTYAKDEYVQKKAAELKASEDLRHKLAALVGLIGNMSAPLLCYAILKSKAAPGQGLVGQLKKLIPAMEYFKGVYMSKWLLVFHIFSNFNAKSVFFFARSTNEMWENFLKAIVFDFLFFVGDDLIAGAAASAFQRKHTTELKGLSLTHKGPLGLTFAKSLSQVEAEASRHGDQKLKELASKLARYNFRIGLLSTSVLLGGILTGINAVLTKWRIENEGGGLQPKNGLSGLLPKAA